MSWCIPAEYGAIRTLAANQIVAERKQRARELVLAEEQSHERWRPRNGADRGRHPDMWAEAVRKSFTGGTTEV